MSVSLPSLEVYTIDVPEIKEFSAEFKYNFFVPNESTSETGGIPTTALERSASEIDTSFIDFVATRVPRLVTFSFRSPRLSDPGRRVTDLQVRNAIFDPPIQNGSLIRDNLDKVVTEDHFALDNFVAVTFHDGEIDDKIYRLASGSFVQLSQDVDVETNNSPMQNAMRLHALTPKQVKPHFAFRALGNMSRTSGTRFFNTAGSRVYSHYFERLRDVVIGMQFNSKLFYGTVSRAVRDPHHPFATDMKNLHSFSKKLHSSARQRFNPQISESDYKTFIPYIDLKVGRTAHHQDRTGPVIVGYIIDKVEIAPDGSTTHHTPLVIDNPKVNFTADLRVRYGASYVYSIRTIALFTLPAIDDDTGEIAMVKALISSKPSKKIYIRTEELVAPPPPSDLNFTWDYERVNPETAEHDSLTGEPLNGTGVPGSLMVHWTFPPNSQRDIKKFQVFRRKNVDDPFELLQVYDFDDSELRSQDRENPDNRLVQVLNSPCTFYYDDDFTADARYIYTVVSIDAHGLTSNYGSQFEVWFDRFKNKLEKKLVSHSGAPKPYPNLYLEADTFVDTVRVSGNDAKRVKLYFNPEFYHLYDDNNRFIKVLSTKQTGGSYKLQFINLDNQKTAMVDVLIDDQIKAASRTLNFPNARVGKKRSQLKKLLP